MPPPKYEYLASPYSHPRAEVRHERYEAVRLATYRLCLAHRIVYSPILHFHDLAETFRTPFDADYWWTHNRTMLYHAGCLLVLMLDGWKNSVGVRQEIEYAESHNIPVSYLHAEKTTELA